MAARSPQATHAHERIALLAFRVGLGLAVTRAYVEREFGVSRATAKRDMALLARVLRGAKATPPGWQPRRVVGPLESRMHRWAETV